MDWEALCSTSCRLVPPPNSAPRRYRGARPAGSNRKREFSGLRSGSSPPSARSLQAFRSLKPRPVKGSSRTLLRDGVAILNADDPHVLAMATRTRARVVTYGLSSEAEIRGRDVRSSWPDRLALTVTHGQEQLHLQTQLVGEYWATSVLAAVACGIACGLGLEACAKAVARVRTGVRPVLGAFGP
jgi:hypothetical protein